MSGGGFLESSGEGGNGTCKAAQQEFIQRVFMNAMSSAKVPRGTRLGE
jgi:hypothetical protein